MFESQDSRRVVVGTLALSIALCLFVWLFSLSPTAGTDTVLALRIAYVLIVVGFGGILLALAKWWIDRGT